MIQQYYTNGGGGAGDPTKARKILPAAGHMLFPSGTSPGIDVAVSPAYSYSKARLGDLGSNEQWLHLVFGKGGTSQREYVDYALVGGQPQGPDSTMPLFEDFKNTLAQFMSKTRQL